MGDVGKSLFDDFQDSPVSGDSFTSDHGELKSLDGASTEKFTEAEVAEVLYHGNVGADDYDGFEAAVIRLHDGRLVAWETWWGPTGSGFSEDAYGGDTDIWFAKQENLATLILQALGDEARRLCGIPTEGLA